MALTVDITATNYGHGLPRTMPHVAFEKRRPDKVRRSPGHGPRWPPSPHPCRGGVSMRPSWVTRSTAVRVELARTPRAAPASGSPCPGRRSPTSRQKERFAFAVSPLCAAACAESYRPRRLRAHGLGGIENSLEHPRGAAARAASRRV